MIVPVAHAVLQPVEAFADTARGAAGFGSTGKISLATRSAL